MEAKNGTACRRYKDLAIALAHAQSNYEDLGEEWRIHFHIPLHGTPGDGLHDTRDHVEGTLDLLAKTPSMCRHLEMETYTWEVLPDELRSCDVVDQIAREYEWTLGELKKRGLRKN